MAGSVGSNGLVESTNTGLSGLPETSGPRVTLSRASGTADKSAGALLGNRDIAKRGADRIERSDKLLSATRLEQVAATRREQARETADAGSRQAARERNAAQKTAASGLFNLERGEPLKKGSRPYANMGVV